MNNTHWMCRRCGLNLTDFNELREQCNCHPSKIQPIEVKKFEPAKGPKIPPMKKCNGCCK